MATVDPLKSPTLGIRTSDLGAAQMRPPASRVPEGNKSFKDVLADTVSEVQRLQNDADTTIKQLVSGQITDVAQAMVAVERADVSFQTMMTVRNRVMTAYDEIMRMQI